MWKVHYQVRTHKGAREAAESQLPYPIPPPQI
jgi:hypothetical protein